MNETITSLIMLVLTLLSVAAWVLAFRKLRAGGSSSGANGAQQAMVAVIAAVCAALFIVRWVAVVGYWQPLTSHLDGLLLLATLLAVTILFIQHGAKLAGLAVFALPLLTLILGWAICAAWWTYRPFNIETLDPVWKAVHLGGVYLGTLFAAMAAVFGGMYLYAQHRIRHKTDPIGAARFASLEALESGIIRSAMLGFALLTLGLVAGVVVLIEGSTWLGPHWWYSPKVVIAVIAWLVYALLMNVRHATVFRGPRAAWLSIAGLVLLLAVYSIVSAMPDAVPGSSPTNVDQDTASDGGSA